MNPIIKEFRDYFEFLKKEDIILYGTGQYTELILKELKDFHFIGLMDSRRTGICYGLPVLSEYEVQESGCKNLIIIANLSNAPMIFQRIKEFVQTHDIVVYYMNGKRLVEDSSDLSIINNPYWEQSKEGLLVSALQYDVISFDLFDTLVMRKCLYPETVFEIVERKALKAGIELTDFICNRKEAERELYHNGKPFYNLTDIYEILRKKYQLEKEYIDKIKQLELDTELEMVIPRIDVIECYKILEDFGKKVVITSDMYLSCDSLKVLLCKCGIQNAELYVSNEWQASKHTGSLFVQLRSEFAGKKILHIGDNQRSDIRNAIEKRIDALYVANADTLMNYYGLEILKDDTEYFSEKCMYEIFVSKCFAYAFKRNVGKGKIYIHSRKELGYLFFGPLVIGYISWLVARLQELEIEHLLFVSRDGYLFYHIYQKIRKQFSGMKLPEASYFLTSRRCASVASLKCEEDVKFVLENVCYNRNMCIGDILKKAYGISGNEEDEKLNETIGTLGMIDTREYIRECYMERILQHALSERDGYLKYIESLGIANKKIGMANFVGRGVEQHCLQKIVDNDITGMYVALEHDADKILEEHNAISWYPERISEHTSQRKLAELLLVGEQIFSAPHGSVISFTDCGNPILERSSEQRINLTKICQEGIWEYVEDVLLMETDIRTFERNVDMADNILGNLNSERFVFSNNIKEDILFEDCYA